MEQLLSRQAELEGQILFETDESIKAKLVDELNMISNQIAEKQYEQAKEAALEEKVHAEGLPFAISGVDFTKMKPELIEVIELVVKADRRRIFAEHAVELEERDNMYASGKVDYGLLEDKYNELVEKVEEQNDIMRQKDHEIRQILTENATLNQQLNDINQKRDAAAAQLEEANAEIARLKDEIADYQKAKVFGEREAQNIIEARPEEAAEINDALKKLYLSFENFGTVNKVLKPDGSYEIVKTAELQKEWIPESEVTGQDSFRGEDTLTPPPFQDEVQDFQHAVGGVTSNAAVETETFADEVRRRLGALEDRVFARVNEVA